MNEVLTEEQSTTVLLETMSGKGSEVGSRFEELREIIDRIELSDHLGVCLDTCHIWDGGYDIVNHLDEVLTEFDRVIGLSRLRAIHLNDSLNPLGAHKDRHARIGEGYIGAEALIRWQHPTRGLLGPGEFLPVAEESGLIEAIDWHMYRLACTAGAPLVAQGGFISINISPRHFQYEDFDQRLLDLLRETGFPPARLQIEVTESLYLDPSEKTRQFMRQLLDLGVKLSVDDFGSGYFP